MQHWGYFLFHERIINRKSMLSSKWSRVHVFIAFLRNERTHSNLVSQARNLDICEDCKLAAPLGSSRGFGPHFRVYLLCHACFLLWLLSWFSTCFWTGFSFWGENKLHHRKARVYETICSRSLISGSFDSGSSVPCLVSERDDVLWLNTWDWQHLLCSWKRLWIALALGR